MYFLAVFCTLLVATSAEFCYNDVQSACNFNTPSIGDGQTLSNCNAKYGNIDNLQVDLQAFANLFTETSFEYLLMSTHFGNYEANRDGFKHLYRKLSDDAWDKSINIIKYIAKRGGRMNFNQWPHLKKSSKDSLVVELTELPSLAKALDLQKQLASQALDLHTQAKHHADPAVAHYVEEEFMESQATWVRNLAGYASDLKGILSYNPNAPLGVYLFDEYLQTVL